MIADFGIIKFDATKSKFSKTQWGSVTYQAPEVTAEKGYNKASDI